MTAELTAADREALVVALYESKIGEYGYLGRPECEQFTEPLVPAVEAIVTAHTADLRAKLAAVEASKPRVEIKRLSDMVSERGALVADLRSHLEAVERLEARWSTEAGPNPRWINELRAAIGGKP